MHEALSSTHKCVLTSGRRESALLTEGSEPAAQLLKQTQQILLAFVAVLRDLALQHDDEVSWKIKRRIISYSTNKREDRGSNIGGFDILETIS